jgi:hypothetical protein
VSWKRCRCSFGPRRKNAKLVRVMGNEDGYELWLRYRCVSEPALLER